MAEGGADVSENIDDVLIPCEFCPRSVPLSEIIQHQSGHLAPRNPLQPKRSKTSQTTPGYASEHQSKNAEIPQPSASAIKVEQHIRHDTFDITRRDDGYVLKIVAEERDEKKTSEKEANESGSITCSANMNLYQSSLEAVLMWLRGAEEKLAAEGSVADDVDKVKEQFHLHEKFMIELTQHQEGAEEVLHEGNKLITQGKITSKEKEEIEVQMKLLNTRCQALRMETVDRQSKLHEKLMVLQQEQLNTMNKWLSEMESKLGHLGPVGPDLAAVQNQVEMQKSSTHNDNFCDLSDDNIAENETVEHFIWKGLALAENLKKHKKDEAGA